MQCSAGGPGRTQLNGRSHLDKKWKVDFDIQPGQKSEDLASQDEKFEFTWIVLHCKFMYTWGNPHQIVLPLQSGIWNHAGFTCIDEKLVQGKGKAI